MTTTIPENEYQDCMKEWRTIEGLQVDKDWLQQENDNLRAQVLQAPDAKLGAFMAAFELWMKEKIKSCRDEIINGNVDLGDSMNICDTWLTWYELKAQHLGDDSGKGE